VQLKARDRGEVMGIEEEAEEGGEAKGIEGVVVGVRWLRMKGGNRAVLGGGEEEVGVRMC
jgi:hypothetical protein